MFVVIAACSCSGGDFSGPDGGGDLTDLTEVFDFIDRDTPQEADLYAEPDADSAESEDQPAEDGPADAPEEELPVTEHGECTSSEDCDGRPCVRVPDEPGGFWTCVDPESEEATECGAPEVDECCTSDDCTEGEDGGCFYHEDISCGGPVYMSHNMCFYTECREDDDCDEDMLCMPKGVYGFLRNTCAYATCRTQLDCSERPEGYCRPLLNPCCPVIAGYYCVDPEVCETDDDCSDGASCVVNPITGWAVCEIIYCPL